MQPVFQYQSHATSYDDSAGYAYDVALMDWWAPWPDFAPGPRPLVAEGWFALGNDEAAAPAPTGLQYAVYPDVVFRHPLVGWPNLAVVLGDWIAVPPDPPDVGPPRVTEPFVPRDPEAPRRTREHLDVVAMILNSFLRQGLIARTGVEDFVIHTGRYAEPRPPTPDDGTDVGATAGATWYDTVGETFWLCKDPTQGTAVWVQISLV